MMMITNMHIIVVIMRATTNETMQNIDIKP